MAFKQFVAKQLIAVIQWNEPEDGILAYRYPMRDMEIQNGAQLTVRESQMALFVNEGKIADVFGPGLYTLNTHNLPVLTDLNNWDKGFESPFKSDVYFFATRLQIDQKWGTATSIIIRDKEFGAISLRCYGIYSYRIGDPRTFFTQVSGTLGTYPVSELEGQLRAMIVGCVADVFANSTVPFLDLTANQSALGEKLKQLVQPAFAALGLELNQFVLESISLPDDLQDLLNQRIGMGMVGDLGHYTQFAAAESLPIAAANTSGAADMGIGLGAGAAVGQVLMGSLRSAAAGALPSTASEARFCTQCGKSIPTRRSLLSAMREAAMNCPSCGAPMRLNPDGDSYKCDFCHSVYVPDKNEDGVRVLGEPSDETCPNCNIALMQAALAKTRILYCTKCRGMLVPMQAFKNLLAELELVQGGSMAQPPADPGDLSRVLNCPHCHQRMDTHLYAGGGNAVLESCEKCLLNWLDHGELARIIHAPDDTNPATMRDLDSDLYEGPI